MPVRARSVARGDVQRVGYRDVVEYAARKLNLTGFVENLKPYGVRIIVEGEQTRIESLIDKIRIGVHPTEQAIYPLPVVLNLGDHARL